MFSEELVTTLERLAAADLSSQEGYAALRPRAFVAVRKLYHRMETAYELSRRLAWQESAHTAGIKIAMNLNLFELLSNVGTAGSISSKELAKASNSNEELVARICRLLASWGTIGEVGEDGYAPTAKSNALVDPKAYSGIDFWFYFANPAFGTFPQFIQEGGYEKIDVPEETNWAKTMSNGVPFFPWLNEHPEKLRSFASHMAGFSVGRATWVDIYPTQERLIDGAEADGPMLVDIGGSTGHDVVRFHEKHPQPPGRLFVQDLPQVVESMRKEHPHESIEFQAHDFNEPQPIKGARAYLLHLVLHDWSDEISHKILSQIALAMKPGYSKVIIGESVVGSRDIDPICTSLDMVVAAIVGSKERTEQNWRDLLSNAGLKLTGIWTSPAANGESVIEAELA